jgi:hypothetical protein
MRSGKVDLMSADVIDALINPVGGAAVAPAAASSGKPSGLAK